MGPICAIIDGKSDVWLAQLNPAMAGCHCCIEHWGTGKLAATAEFMPSGYLPSVLSHLIPASEPNP